MSKITKVTSGSLICIIMYFQTQKQQSHVSFKLQEAKNKFKTSLGKPSWFCAMKIKPAPITTPQINSRIKSTLGQEGVHETKSKAIKGWLNKYCKQLGLSSVVEHGIQEKRT